MIVTRLTANSKYGFAGDQVNENVISFEKMGDSIFISALLAQRSISPPGNQSVFTLVSRKALAIENNIKDIPCRNIINVTGYLQSDDDFWFFLKQPEMLGTYLPDQSSVSDIKCYDDHVEISSVKIFQNGKGERNKISLNTSFMLLPETPMRIRYADKRLNYFLKRLLANGSGKEDNVITRWRLQPRISDLQKYKERKLVEPEKPIVFYIDPATPPQWVPYFIEGVNIWQKAFEKAGFKNAISAKKAPTLLEDSEWSLYSAKYSAILFQDNDEPNSSYSTVIDPRTGEILECHVRMFRGIFKWLRELYFIQASPSDLQARKMIFKNDLLGRLVKMVVTHEVGHALGLDHNMIASNAVPVEKLRDRHWLMKNGITPSIMDYARFNYVAQPGDAIDFDRGLINNIGVYDEWAIEWGYRIIDGIPAFEKGRLKNWIAAKTNDKKYRTSISYDDPRTQSESLGDDAVLASEYGLRNLQFVLSHLKEWAKGSGKDELKEIYEKMLGQFRVYMEHVSSNIGGLYETSSFDEKMIYKPVPIGVQLKAVSFFDKQIFTTPEWLLDKEIITLIGINSEDIIKQQQENVITVILNQGKLRNLLYSPGEKKAKFFNLDRFFTHMRKSIFSELHDKLPLSIYRKNLQLLYIEALLRIVNNNVAEIVLSAGSAINEEQRSNIRIQIRRELKHLQKDLQAALVKPKKETATIKHYQIILQKILNNSDATCK
jgi:hypothetical protein